MRSISTEVLVIGGGPVGTALHLNQQGVDRVLVEKRACSGPEGHTGVGLAQALDVALGRQLGEGRRA